MLSIVLGLLVVIAVGSGVVVAWTLRYPRATAPAPHGVALATPLRPRPTRALAVGTAIRWALGFSLLPALLQGLRFLVLTLELPPDDWYGFLAMGVPAGTVLGVMRAVGPERRARSAAIGYLLALPVALMGSLLAGLLYPSLVGGIVYGAPPLLVGTLAGWLWGPGSRP